MELMFSSFLLFICWFPAIILSIISIFLSKEIQKNTLKGSLILFLIPILIFIVLNIKDSIVANSITGTYELENKLTFEIKSNRKFTIKFKNCKEKEINGSWHYSSDYDAFMFSADNYQIQLSEDSNGKYGFYSDIKSNCVNLESLYLTKIE